MTTDAKPSPAVEANNAEKLVGRRSLFRAGAVVAGAAAASAAGAVGAGSARAANGDPVLAGQGNAASSTTSLTVGGANGAPSKATLALNNADGPSLSLEPLPSNWAGQLAVGQMAGGELGPVVGVDTVTGTVSTYLATGVDLANIPTPFASFPSRIVDLRYENKRTAIIRQSASDALTTDGKLRAGQWIDLAIVPLSPDYALEAIFGNLTVVRPARHGIAVIFAPGVRPLVRSLTFNAGQTTGNAAFVGVGSVLGYYAVRLYTSRTAWFLFDVTGGVTTGNVRAPLPQTAALRARGGRQAIIRRLRQALTRTSR